MKKHLFAPFLILVSTITNATIKDSTIIYDLPDSVKAIAFMAEIKVTSLSAKGSGGVSIRTDAVGLGMTSYKNHRGFNFGSGSFGGRQGLNTYYNSFKSEDGGMFNYNWQINESYRLLIAQATDSAGNFSLYSGYVFLPKENKWKLIGTSRIDKRWNAIQRPAFNYSTGKKYTTTAVTGEVWVQRQNGSWKNMKNETLPNPTINWFGHLDSAQQRSADIQLIGEAIISGKTDAKEYVQGLYYKMMKEGAGRQVTVNDTVTVHYKGYLFANDSVFDQTREKPATFPLKRLIRGWQIGVPLCKVGGKIKLVIPSDLAYSIRTRAAKIPPNSILVFEIEVLDAKSGN